jgi:uncharacterized protein YjhX (UPF0386 family)
MLAQGGRILQIKDDRGDIIAVDCMTRDRWRLADCTLGVFRKFWKRRLIRSRGGGLYLMTHEGLAALLAQVYNRKAVIERGVPRCVAGVPVPLFPSARVAFRLGGPRRHRHEGLVDSRCVS